MTRHENPADLLEQRIQASMSTQNDLSPRTPSGDTTLLEELHLGDGAYARIRTYEVELYTSDGISERDHVHLDPYALNTLLRVTHKYGLVKP